MNIWNALSLTASRRRPAAAAVAATVASTAAAVLASAPEASAAPAGVAAAPAPNPTAVGRLTPRGCAGSPGAVTCDLYAKAGTTVLTGGSSVPIWGFATDSTADATAPGPLLVVTQGDSVSITVHNDLQGAGNVSLALPGQAPGDVGTSGDDTTGAAPGSSKTYTFRATRPGTFLYEAGHTPEGARQVAMGLAGALVVLPSNAGSLDGNPAGYPDTSYDDDAVLVLSEIDPALNRSADPLAFDMRNFRPGYRLINGHSYPSAAGTIATDQGHKVLVRYVNVGQQMHAMGVLGVSQVEVADDGHPAKYSTTVNAEDIDPGETLDTVVTMPGDPQAAPTAQVPTKVAIYETNGALDNDAQVTADTPPRIAFGGMLAFLDTQATVDTSQDYVGPKASAISVSPNPSDALSPVTVTATVDDSDAGGSSIKAAEYVIDNDDPNGPIAAGSGVAMTVPDGAGPITSVTGTIPQSVLADPTLSAGKHVIYVRGEDGAGNWGVFGSTVLNVPKTGPATTGGTATPSLTNGTTSIALSATGDDTVANGKIVAAEYFVGDAPADASVRGTAMTINRSASVVSVDATVPVSVVKTLSPGVNHLWVRVKDDFGLWGPVLDIPVTMDTGAPTVLGAAMNPPATNGKQGDPSNPGYVRLSAELQDVEGSRITQAEAFLNTVGTNGKGLQLRPVDGRLDSSDETVYGLIALSQLTAFKQDTKIPVYVHGKDAAGNWGDATATNAVATLILDRTAPVLGATLRPALGQPGSNLITLSTSLTEASPRAGEYWTGNTDPGAGKATPITINTTVPDANGNSTVSIDVPRPAAATTYHLRVQDMAGNWSTAATVTVRPFRNLMETANSPFGWSSATNGARISRTAAARQPNPDEPTSANGLQISPALTSATTRTAFVTDTGPVAATQYHARFQFAASSLNSGANANNVVTVFDTTNLFGTEVFGLQYRGAGTNAQIRAVVGNTAGQWKTVGAGTHNIQLDWNNGANAALVLTVDGTPQYTVNGNTTATIEAARLGVVQNSVASTTTVGTVGNAWFDTFLSASS
jgi:FtsP/CotA-like multicopper oxidase with cupredoxin domain